MTTFYRISPFRRNMRKIYGDVKDLQNKPAHRLKNIREAARKLFHSSHNGGAGGIHDSELGKYLLNVIAECDRLLGE